MDNFEEFKCDAACTIADLCGAGAKGRSAFYEVMGTKKESVSLKKQLVLLRKSGEVLVDGEARTALGSTWTTGAVKVCEADIQAVGRLFVQTTSHNRKLVPGQRVLLEAEAGGSAPKQPRKRAKTATSSSSSSLPAPDTASWQAFEKRIRDADTWAEPLVEAAEMACEEEEDMAMADPDEAREAMVARLMGSLRGPASEAEVRAAEGRLDTPLPASAVAVMLVHDGQTADGVGDDVFGLVPGVITARLLPMAEWTWVRDEARFSGAPTDDILIGKATAGAGFCSLDPGTGFVTVRQTFDSRNWLPDGTTLGNLIGNIVASGDNDNNQVDLWVEHGMDEMNV